MFRTNRQIDRKKETKTMIDRKQNYEKQTILWFSSFWYKALMAIERQGQQ